MASTINLNDWLEEDVDSIAPNTAGSSWKQGRAVSTYRTKANMSPGINDLQTLILNILGDVTAFDSTVSLKRQLPVAHPAFQYFYASAINEIKGIGAPRIVTVPNATTGLEVPPILTQYALYPRYNFVIEFTPRPYALLKDSKIITTEDDWIDETGVNQQYTFANEWTRFTDWEPEASSDNVTATQGEMILRGTQAPIKNLVYNGMPRMFLNNQLIKFTWYQVPYSFITSTNSYIKKYRGRINQDAWYNWDAGSLLYLGYKIVRYTPPVQQLLNFPNPFSGASDDSTGSVQFSTEKFVDIEFQFLETVRTTNDDYVPTNGNWIVKGHNLVPIAIDRRFFHYATSYKLGVAADQTQWVPSWLSFAFPLLFQNPDAPQP